MAAPVDDRVNKLPLVSAVDEVPIDKPAPVVSKLAATLTPVPALVASSMPKPMPLWSPLKLNEARPVDGEETELEVIFNKPTLEVGSVFDIVAR